MPVAMPVTIPGPSFLDGITSVLGHVGDAATNALGLDMNPKLVGGNRYEPSPFSLNLFTQPQGNYVWEEAAGVYTGNKKILVFLTAEGDMTMENGKVFVSGNHPVETLVPMLHLEEAGFQFEFATPGGRPGVIEKWALPLEETAVMDIYNRELANIANPLRIEDIDVSLSDYAAVYLPGGHGAMLGLPENRHLGELLHSAHKQSIPTVTICHGPAALIAASVGHEDETFIYDGYEIMVFPDNVDKYTPGIGYLPGNMPWWLEADLTSKGMVSKTIPLLQGQTTSDRELISGDSPAASNNLGVLAAPILLDYVEKLEPGSVTRPVSQPTLFEKVSGRIGGLVGGRQP